MSLDFESVYLVGVLWEHVQLRVQGCFEAAIGNLMYHILNFYCVDGLS